MHLYGVAHSGWKSPRWNWGSAVGTGHDCATICRRHYSSRSSRSALVDQLLTLPTTTATTNTNERDLVSNNNLEEVKLVLALAWQKGRWDGSDGGLGGYGDVLQEMVKADRYEEGSSDECARRLVHDMQNRFILLKPSRDQLASMNALWDDCELSATLAQQRCSGLVLAAMGFVERGI
jgi:hypothetical protein